MTVTVEPPETIAVTRKRLLDTLTSVLDPEYCAMDSWGTDVYSIDMGTLEDFVEDVFDKLKATGA